MIVSKILKRKRLQRVLSAMIVGSMTIPMLMDTGIGIGKVYGAELKNNSRSEHTEEVGEGSEESNIDNVFDHIKEQWVLKASDVTQVKDLIGLDNLKGLSWEEPLALNSDNENRREASVTGVLSAGASVVDREGNTIRVSDDGQKVYINGREYDNSSRIKDYRQDPIYEYDEDGVLKYPFGDPKKHQWEEDFVIYRNYMGEHIHISGDLANNTITKRKGLYFILNIKNMKDNLTTTAKVNITADDYNVMTPVHYTISPELLTDNYANLEAVWKEQRTWSWKYLFPYGVGTEYEDFMRNNGGENHQFIHRWAFDVPEHCEWYYSGDIPGSNGQRLIINNALGNVYNAEGTSHTDNSYRADVNGIISSGGVGATDLDLDGYKFWNAEQTIWIAPCEDILEIDPNGGNYNGSSDIQQVIKECTEVTDIEEPIRVGYEFVGWDVVYKDNNNRGEFNDTMTEYTHEGNRARYVKEYPGDEYYTYYGTEVVAKNDISGAGRIQEDSEKSGYFYKYSAGDENLNRLTKTTIKAMWRGKGYSLLLEKNPPAGDNGKWDFMDRMIFGWNEFKALSKNTYTSKGYHFIGWNTERDGSGTSYSDEEVVGNLSDVNGDEVRLYAQWEPNSYYFRYNGNTPTNASDTVENIPETEKFTYNIKDTLKADTPSLTGWKFNSWRDSADGTGNIFSSGTEMYNYTTDNDIYYDLYAQWEPNRYTVRFNGNKPVGTANSIQASSSDVTGTMTDEEFIYDNEQALNQNQYSLEGWKFKGWTTGVQANNYTTVEYTDGQTVKNLTLLKGKAEANKENAVVDLFAQWEPNKYYIDYDSNVPSGASIPISGNMSTQEMLYDKEEALNTNQYQLSGYLFMGWNTSADGTGTSYTDGDTVKNLVNTDKGHIILYAQWIGSDYVIHYNANTPLGISNATHRASNKVTGSMEDTTHPSGITTYILVNKFKLKGWEFIGWTLEDLDKNYTDTEYTDGDDASKIIADYLAKGIISKEDSIQIYAQWRANRYLIKFASNGGQGSMLDMECSYDKRENLTENTYRYEDTNYRQTTYNSNGLPYNHSYQTAFKGQFMNWESSQDGNTVQYEDKQSVLNLGGEQSDRTDVITMYACWNMLPNINIRTEDTHLLFYEGARISSTDLLKKVVAYDKEDGDLTREIEVYKIVYVNGDEDTNVRTLNTSAEHIGSYSITYRVQDKQSSVYVYETYIGKILYNNIPDVEVDFMDRYMYRQDIEAITMDELEVELGRLVNISDIEDTGIDNSDPNNVDDERYWGDTERKLSVQNIENVYNSAVKSSCDIVIIFTYFDSYGKPNADASGRFTLHIIDKDLDPAIEENSSERHYVRFISDEYIDTLESGSLWRGSKHTILEDTLTNSKDNSVRTFEVHK